MPVELAIWRMKESGLQQLTASPMDFELRLEDMLERTPSMIGTELLIVGRQVTTSFGGIVDLLALDVEGRLHVLELKRHRTPRDAVAQVLDYGTWAEALSFEDIEQEFSEYRGDDTTLEAAFAECFASTLPERVNDEQQLTIVASELDPTSERIVHFLRDRFGVPINAILFRHFTDAGREYLARTWLHDPRPTDAPSATASRSKRPPWNGRDFYAVVGRVDNEAERYTVARKYGFLNAGGGEWFWKPLRNLRPKARVFVYVGGAGYVGVASVTGSMIPAREARVDVDGTEEALIDRPDVSEEFRERAQSEDPEKTEMVVPVEWVRVVSLDQAVGDSSLFSVPTTVCKLRDRHTIETVENALGLSSAE